MKKTLICVGLLLTNAVTHSAAPYVFLDRIPHVTRELSAKEQLLQKIKPLYMHQINQLRQARRTQKKLPNRVEIQIKGRFLGIMINYLSDPLYEFSYANLPSLLSHAKHVVTKQGSVDKAEVYTFLEPLLQEIMIQFSPAPTST